MFTEYTKEEIARQESLFSGSQSKSSDEEAARALNEGTELKDNEDSGDDLNAPTLFDMEEDSLW